MSNDTNHRQGVHRYRNVTDGVAMANEYLSSRLSVSEFARQKGVSFTMVKYWCACARQLAAAASASTPPPMRTGHLVPIGTIDENHAIIVAQPPVEDHVRSAPPPLLNRLHHPPSRSTYPVVCAYRSAPASPPRPCGRSSPAWGSRAELRPSTDLPLPAAGGHAQGLRLAGRPGAGGSGHGPIPGRCLRVRRQGSHPCQGAGLRARRILAVRQAAGGVPFPTAGRR